MVSYFSRVENCNSGESGKELESFFFSVVFGKLDFSSARAYIFSFLQYIF